MANPSELLFDTTALIDIYRGQPSVQSHFDAVLNGEVQPYISTLTEAELWRGMHLEELEMHEAIVDQFLPIPVDSDVARLAGTWMQRYSTDGLGWMDALITATGKIARLPVVTRDKQLTAVLAEAAEFELYGN